MKRTIRIFTNCFSRFLLEFRFNLKNKSPRVFAMSEVRDFDKPTLYIGSPGWALRLLRHGLDLETLETVPGGRTACIGFNPAEGKWYGWSHRAMYGFGVGTEVKPGDCAFVPGNREEYKDELLRWYLDDAPELTGCTIHEMPEGIRITRTYLDQRTRITDEPLDIEYGRGRWTASTLDEAKQMALEFAKAVS